MFKTIFLHNRFYLVFGAMVIGFVVAYLFPPLFPVMIGSVFLGLGAVLVDGWRLFRTKRLLSGKRSMNRLLSNGDLNPIKISLYNHCNINLEVTLIDELPIQLQVRDFALSQKLAPLDKQVLHYEIRPTVRGDYAFGYLYAYVSTAWSLVIRRITIEEPITVPVYPSIIQMKQFEWRSSDRLLHLRGLKKMRRIGHSYEFEQIKNYVKGDDYRSINWKASGRRAALMVNQYEDERAQQVYNFIDKSRVMRLPFEGLSLMDHAINTSLTISNLALKKHDRAGLFTFSDKVGTFLKADSHPKQLRRILQALYNEQERDFDANYEYLYYASRKLINGRSLILLYTNFESEYALERVLPVLRNINKFHLLVVIFFENTEIRAELETEDNATESIYFKTILRKNLFEKNQMVQKLRHFGIQAVLTTSSDLPVKTINKYLELKSKGLI